MNADPSTFGTSPTTAVARPGWRRAAEWTLPTAAITVAVLLPLLVWNRLPEPMASHWGPGGDPDASLPRLVDLLVLALATAAIAVGPLSATRARMPRWSARLLVATATGGSALMGTLRVLTVRANLDVTSWEAAGSLSPTTVLLVFTGAAAVAAAGAWLAGDRPDHVPASEPAPTLAIAPGEAVVWSGRVSGRLGVVVPALLLVGAAVSAWLVPGETRTLVVVALLVVALALTTLGQVRVTIGPKGVSVGLGWLGWPRLRVPIADVAEVAVEQVDPMTYGGWGVRLTPKTTAVVIRRGEGIRIGRVRGRTFVVTVDDAARGAGVLLAHQRTTA